MRIEDLKFLKISACYDSGVFTNALYSLFTYGAEDIAILKKLLKKIKQIINYICILALLISLSYPYDNKGYIVIFIFSFVQSYFIFKDMKNIFQYTFWESLDLFCI